MTGAPYVVADRSAERPGLRDLRNEQPIVGQPGCHGRVLDYRQFRCCCGNPEKKCNLVADLFRPILASDKQAGRLAGLLTFGGQSLGLLFAGFEQPPPRKARVVGCSEPPLRHLAAGFWFPTLPVGDIDDSEWHRVSVGRIAAAR